ncbi:hypothetical protein [Streptomyces luteolus]|uniref:Uncharacterized protein n=1 Tax=Streptomyces luteolus TaxID=3043615 RepID=A0ABT6SZ49_9ACTN|nr:hypothetical protein [Streptomyces sp. B-S-A12]MDI3420676.1 hypothetical protein [Streptomyces sp. B-S-A12]
MAIKKVLARTSIVALLTASGVVVGTGLAVAGDGDGSPGGTFAPVADDYGGGYSTALKPVDGGSADGTGVAPSGDGHGAPGAGLAPLGDDHGSPTSGVALMGDESGSPGGGSMALTGDGDGAPGAGMSPPVSEWDVGTMEAGNGSPVGGPAPMSESDGAPGETGLVPMGENEGALGGAGVSPLFDGDGEGDDY